MFELGNDIVFLSNPSEVSSYVNANFDTIIFDCDGVLYRGGDTAIPRANEAIRTLMVDQQKQVLFLTNNAEYSRRQLRDKISSVLLNQSSNNHNNNDDDNDDDDDDSAQANREKKKNQNDESFLLTEDQMITSSYSTAKYLYSQLCTNDGTTGDSNSKASEDCNIYVVGSQGLCREIEQFGFHVTSSSSINLSSSSSMDRSELASYSFDKEEEYSGTGTGSSDTGNSDTEKSRGIDAIVIGLDTDFTYRKLCIVAGLLKRYPHALFVATNTDAFDVVDNDSEHDSLTTIVSTLNLPGNGSIVKAIEVASQREAINVGKPSQVLVELLREEYDFDLDRTVMVGDRLDTDVKFGRDGGMKSALVLTGCTTVTKLMDVDGGDASAKDEEPLPHIIFPNMGMMAGPANTNE